MTDKDFDNSSMEIDQYCVNHDVDDYDLFGESNKKCGHGDNWKMIMLQLGLKPDKYHPMRLK